MAAVIRHGESVRRRIGYSLMIIGTQLTLWVIRYQLMVV
jgi:hypothetical protein